MHVVNRLEEGQRLLHHARENREASSGHLSPRERSDFQAGPGQNIAMQKVKTARLGNPGEGAVEHADRRPHPDLQPNAEEAFGQIRPLPRGEAEPASHSQPVLHLCSPPYAACYAGVNYYRHVVDALKEEFPDVPFTFTIDCGDDAAVAFEALRMGFTHVTCDCNKGQFAELERAASGCDAVVERPKNS